MTDEGLLVTSVTLTDGTVIPAEKLVCPVCRTVELDLDFEATTDPAGGWLVTDTPGHHWLLAPDGDGWSVWQDFGGGYFGGELRGGS